MAGIVFTARVDSSGIERTFNTIATNAKQLDAPLKIFDRYFRSKVAQRFAAEGPGWPARKETKEQVAKRGEAAYATAIRKLKNKLAVALEKATKKVRLGGGERSVAAMARRHAALREFERQVSGGKLGGKTDLKAAKLEGRIVGMRTKAQTSAIKSTQLLGRLANSIASKINKGSLMVFSRPEWSGVQNDGGPVGRGATLPPRPFMFLEDDDLDILSDILINHLLLMVE